MKKRSLSRRLPEDNVLKKFIRFVIFFTRLSLVLLAMHCNFSRAQQPCAFRGDLAPKYCDSNRDLLADPPEPSEQFLDPPTLVFANDPTEDSTKYQKIFAPFTEYLSRCVGRPVVFYQSQSNGAEVEALLNGQIHLGCFSTGTTVFAVNTAGAIPFAIRASKGIPHGVNMLVIVRNDSPARSLVDLKGKIIAHTSPTSNSGNIAPRVLLPRENLVPEKDYQVRYSGRHDRSIRGVLTKNYDAAVVASDVFDRLAARGDIQADAFRIVHRSQAFPVEVFAYAHNLEPRLREQLKRCVLDFKYPHSMQIEFHGADGFVAVDYAKDWKIIRDMIQASNNLVQSKSR